MKLRKGLGIMDFNIGLIEDGPVEASEIMLSFVDNSSVLDEESFYII